MMSIRFCQSAFFAAFLLAFVSSCANERSKPVDWSPPVGGVVRDGKAAISIACAVYFSMRPELSGQNGTEEIWQNSMIARLEGDVWVVETPTDPNKFSDGVRILLSKLDARIVGFYVWQ
jgi:hypothetical protein